MIRLVTTFFAFSIFSCVFGQAKLNMELQSHITYDGIAGSGCWGHTDKNGIEYAIIGVFNGIRIYSLEDPKNPIERLFIPGENNSWREIRTWDDYIYVTTEGPDGVTIIDATQAPNNFNFKRWFPEIPNTGTLSTHHSINLDTLGYLYINGTNVPSRGVLMFNLNNDPFNPEFVANIGNVYTHDCYANADYLYTCDLGNGVAIYDIKDRTNPVFLNRFQTSSSFTHNAWTSDDGTYLYTTDERSGAYVDVYDVSDPMNVKFINKYRNKDSQLGRVIPHNTYQVKNWAVTSWYTDGILIKDMTRPDNIVKVGEYDTFYDEANIQNAGTWFYGCWGVYPFFKSGTIIGSDINSGLWVLKPEYKRASYLEGRVLIEQAPGDFVGVPNAIVKIVNDRVAEDESDQQGVYKTGLVGEGSYKAYVIHPDLTFDTAFVELSPGNVTTHDFIIQAKSLRGRVTDQNGQAIPFASVSLYRAGKPTDFSTTTNLQGDFDVPVFRADSNAILVAAWGYKGASLDIADVDDEALVALEAGYEDDFFADLGWTNPQKAGTGNWERVVPKATNFDDGSFANCPADVTDDLGNLCFVTGNGGNSLGENDVDNGLTKLESPLMDFSNSDTAFINYAYWFVTGGGNGPSNDDMKISISNGSTSLELTSENVTDPNWRYITKEINNAQIPFTSTMKLVFDIQDANPGHIVEGGLDHFSVVLNQKAVSVQDEASSAWSVYPSVGQSTLWVEGIASNQILEILNGQGVVVKKIKTAGSTTTITTSDLPNGLYFVKKAFGKTDVKKVFVKN